MAAYAAVISLKHTINGLLNSSRISLVSSTRELLESSYNEATSLQQVLERLNDSSRSRSKSSNERLDGLEGQIRDFANKLEDVLEFHELNSEEEDEEVIREQICSFGETVKEMEKHYIQELSRDDDDDGDDDAEANVPSNIDFGVDMVACSFSVTGCRNILLERMRPDDLWFYAFLGGHGSGRTVVATAIFEDVRNGTATIFDCWAWVTVGTKYDVKDVLLSIIAQVGRDDLATVYELHSSKEDEKLSKYLYELLEDLRYVIVLDDVDDAEFVKYLKTTSFPDQSNGSLVLLTTSSEEVVQLAPDTVHTFECSTNIFEEKSWSIIHEYIFDFEPVPAELEVAGKKIIDNCRCLVIPFTKAFLFLLDSDKTVEEWSKIAADKENPIYMVEDECSEVRQIQSHIIYCEEEIGGMVSYLVGHYHDIESIKMKLHPERFFSRMQIISFFGMAGIGKSTLARKLFKDESILSHFDHLVWITLGPKYQTEEILIDILVQIYPHIDKFHMKGDEKLAGELCVQLYSKRCFIVLDDLCSKEPLLHLKNIFPNIKGTAWVTTRLAKVAKFERDDAAVEMQLLDKEESWFLLRQRVFGGGLCPPELEKIGHKIAEMCDGLPLLILTVADELLKVEMSQEYWNNVASGKEKSIFKNAHHQISEALLPSYQSLPQHLKPCFLYMGVFREKYEILTSILTNMWISEGFLETNPYQKEEDFVAECLSDLVDTSLLMVQRNVSGFQMKTYRLHSVFWHLSNSQAVKNKFFHAMNTYDDCSMESMESQRRLCIRNSILLGIKYVQNSMASNRNAHSLLCVSPLHQYPVPLNLDLRLLRVMYTITIRLYEFPIEVVRLVHLRYLGLTCNGRIPTSISNLWKLQYLILKRHMSIRSSQNSSPLPAEIWDMKELKHLQVMGGCLPTPKCGTGLLKLSTLLDVSAQSCRKSILKLIPNLKRLGIQIELVPGDEDNSFRCLNNISRLRKLESLKCVVVNPQIGSEVVVLAAPISMFPRSLKKLSLSGLGYPWEHMSIIGKLKNLEVLKLKCYAFQGPKWEMDHTSLFKKLKFLSIEDTNLVEWILHWKTADNLEHLCIKHCYKLQVLPICLHTPSLAEIEIVDCSPLTVSWAEQMALMMESRNVFVHNSWLAKTHQG